MRLFITGATGLIGRRLVADRLERGDQLVLLSRSAARASRLFAADDNPQLTIVQGDPSAPGAWQQALSGCDAVIHLAGAGVADRRWTKAYKRTIRESRVESTHQIVKAMQSLPQAQRPRVLVNASAAGYYGEPADPERELDESSTPGDDFLARVVVEWEQAALRAESFGVRAVMLRFGVVLDEPGGERGGALAKMITPFEFFVGGPIGLKGGLRGGRQFMPWIHWRDVIGLIDFALEHSELRGPINAVAPQQVRNREFAKAIGRALKRPSWLPAPRLALRLALGEVANYIAMSQRIKPAKALEHGYVFQHPDIDSALKSLLASKRRS